MPIPSIPPDKMSVEEKLQTIEAIWESVSATPEDIESPVWHEKELRVREAQIASGGAKFVDWEKAKEEIRRQTS
ncbi:MAG: addiction module protein [Chthoniobacterales bacterium]